MVPEIGGILKATLTGSSYSDRAIPIDLQCADQ